MLVGGQQRAQCPRLDGGQQDQGARPVAGESLVPVLATGGIGRRLAQCQCGTLCQAVGDQDLVARIIRTTQAVGVGLAGDDEVDRHDIRTLMQLLEEGMLGVGARHAPDHR